MVSFFLLLLSVLKCFWIQLCQMTLINACLLHKVSESSKCLSVLVWCGRLWKEQGERLRGQSAGQLGYIVKPCLRKKCLHNTLILIVHLIRAHSITAIQFLTFFYWENMIAVFIYPINEWEPFSPSHRPGGSFHLGLEAVADGCFHCFNLILYDTYLGAG